MEVSSYWKNKLKEVDRGLYVEFNNEFGRLHIKHKDDRTGLIRDVMFVQDLDNKPCEINDNLINYLRKSIEWDRIAQYPNPDDLWKSIERDLELAKKKRYLERMGFIFDYNREHKREWREAMNREMSKKEIQQSLKKAEKQRWENRKITNTGRGY